MCLFGPVVIGVFTNNYGSEGFGFSLCDTISRIGPAFLGLAPPACGLVGENTNKGGEIHRP